MIWLAHLQIVVDVLSKSCGQWNLDTVCTVFPKFYFLYIIYKIDKLT